MKSSIFFLPLFLFAYNFFGVSASYSYLNSSGGGVDVVVGAKKSNARVYWKLGLYGYEDNSTISQWAIKYDYFLNDNLYIGSGAYYVGFDNENSYGFSVSVGSVFEVENVNLDISLEEIFLNNGKNILNFSLGINYKFDGDSVDFYFPF